MTLSRSRDINTKIIYIVEEAASKESICKVHAFDLMCKPISEEKICSVINEAIYYLENSHTFPKYVFKTEQGIVALQLEDIYYFEYEDRKVKIATVNGDYFANYSLKTLYCKLSKYNFELSHKSFIVNMLHIKAIKKFDIIMNNCDSIPLAQKRAVIFKNRFQFFLDENYVVV